MFISPVLKSSTVEFDNCQNIFVRHFVSQSILTKGVLPNIVISSEGALYVILPYDYPAQRPLFEHTPVLNNNLSIDAMMTLLTMISMMTKITEIT